MALVLKDRISETSTTSGTGAITLAGATSGFVAFSTIGNGNTTYYCITDGAAWEVGLGTYTSSGNTLARTTVYSNSNGNTTPITLSGGIKNVFGVLPADGIITVSGTSIQVPGTAVLSVANGGTGANTLTSNNVILGNGTSAVQFVAPGTSSNVLTSNGTTWVSQAPAGGGGKVLQVVQYVFTAAQSIASGTFTATSVAATITPSSTSSKVLILSTVSIGAAGGNEGASVQLWMNGSLVGPVGDAAGSRIQAWYRAGEWVGNNSQGAMGMNYLHSPASTSALTYTIYMRGYSASYPVKINAGDTDTDTAFTTRGTSSITLMEIGA